MPRLIAQHGGMNQGDLAIVAPKPAFDACERCYGGGMVVGPSESTSEENSPRISSSLLVKPRVLGAFFISDTYIEIN